MPTRTPSNVFFPLVVVMGGLFAVTILAMLAALFGDPQAPPNRFFSAYGLPLVIVETVLLVGTGFAALAVDGRQIRKAQESALQPPPTPASSREDPPKDGSDVRSPVSD